MITFLLITIFSLVSCDNNKLSHEFQLNRKNATKIPFFVNTSNEMLVSEGGLVSTEKAIIDLLRNNSTVLLSLDNEIGKTKKKPSVPRKEAGVYVQEVTLPALIKHLNITTHLSNNETFSHKNVKGKDINISTTPTTNVTAHPTTNVTAQPTANLKAPSTIALINKTVVNSTKPPKMKPLIVSYENLVNSYNNQTRVNNIDKAYATNATSFHNLKKNIYYADNSPEMIMPIVITILVVPVFLVLSVMAFRRGREAWRNRHYKRMDFLLDGMYND